MQIVRACERRLSIPLEELKQRGRVRFFAGRSEGGVACVGWNINLQSSFGVSGGEMDVVGETVAAVAATSYRPGELR